MRKIKVKDLKPGMVVVGFQDNDGSEIYHRERHSGQYDSHTVASVTDLGPGHYGYYRFTATNGISEDVPGEGLMLVR